MTTRSALPEERSRRSRRLRWYELLPEIVIVVGLTVFLIDEPDAATSALKSTRALTIMAVGGAGWVIARLITWRVVRWFAVRAAVFGVGAIAALAVIVLPAYDDKTVIEAFPGGSADPAPSTSVPARSVPTSTAVTPTAPSTTARRATAPSTSSGGSDSPTTTIAPDTGGPTGPVVLRSGSFEGIDHRAMGTVRIYRDVDGSHVVGLEGFEIQPGPDYDVYVVPGPDREDIDGAIRLDDLRGNIGTQFYVVPADVDVGVGEWTVLVWCQTFGVPIANATPTEV